MKPGHASLPYSQMILRFTGWAQMCVCILNIQGSAGKKCLEGSVGNLHCMPSHMYTYTFIHRERHREVHYFAIAAQGSTHCDTTRLCSLSSGPQISGEWIAANLATLSATILMNIFSEKCEESTFILASQPFRILILLSGVITGQSLVS